MAWNRPSETKVEVEGRGRQWNVHLKGLAAGVIVVIGAAVAAWWLWPTTDRADETPPPQKEGLIKEVKPAATPKSSERKPRLSKEECREHMKEVTRKILANSKNPNARLALERMEHPSDQTFYIGGTNDPSAAREIFKYDVERQIDALIDIQPGERIVEIPYSPDLEKDFVASLKEPIEILPEDTPHEIERKKMMIEAKAQIDEEMKSGRSLVSILTEAREQANKLADYTDLCQNELNRMASTDATREDLEDAVKAMNRLIEEKGGTPIKLSNFLKHKALQRKKLQMKGQLK